MAVVRTITRARENGERYKRFQLDYYDADGQRHKKNFKTFAAADSERIRVEGQIAGGTHIPDSKSLTVIAGLRAWLAWYAQLVVKGLRQQSTWDQYDDHVNHIGRHDIAGLKLSRLRTSNVQTFLDAFLLDTSPELSAKVKTTFSTAIDWCQQKEWIAGNPIGAAAVVQTDRIDDEEDVPWPTKAEVKAIIDTARGWANPASPNYDAGRALAMLMLGFFNGPRASELLGFERKALTLSNAPDIKVVQRLDRQGRLGAPKSKAGRRALPLWPATVAALKSWLRDGLPGIPATKVTVGQGKSRDALMLFPYLSADDRARQALKKGEQRRPAEGIGKPMQYHIFYHHIWSPILIEAGVVTTEWDAEGNEIATPRFGPHYMRHVCASILIAQKIPHKRVQVLIGHSDFKLFMDTYGHLFEDKDADAVNAQQSENSILG